MIQEKWTGLAMYLIQADSQMQIAWKCVRHVDLAYSSGGWLMPTGETQKQMRASFPSLPSGLPSAETPDVMEGLRASPKGSSGSPKSSA